MVRGTVVLALLFVSWANVVSVPYNYGVTVLKDSTLRYNLGAGDSRNSGKLDGRRTIDFDLPGDTAKHAPEIILLEKVESGASIALGGDQNIEKIKDKIVNGVKSFWSKLGK